MVKKGIKYSKSLNPSRLDIWVLDRLQPTQINPEQLEQFLLADKQNISKIEGFEKSQKM